MHDLQLQVASIVTPVNNLLVGIASIVFAYFVFGEKVSKYLITS